MSRRIESRDGVLREQEPEEEHVQGADATVPRTVVLILEQVTQALLVIGADEQDAKDDRHADDMPPDADVAQESYDPTSEGVENTVRGDDDHEAHEDVPRGWSNDQIWCRNTVDQLCIGVHVDETDDVVGQCIVDRRDDAYLTDEVEPAREPTPQRAVLGGQLGRPEVQPASCGIGGTDLAHRHSDQQGEEPYDSPADGDDQRATERGSDPVTRESTRKDGDNRETDREVAECAHPSTEFLGVAHAVQVFPVLVNDVSHLETLLAATPPSRSLAQV